MPGGRPSEKPDNLPELVSEYLKDRTDDGDEVKLPTISGFARKIGFNETTMYEWAKTDTQFSKSLGEIKAEQKDRLLNKGLSGKYNSTIAKLVLSANHGMVEKKEIDQTNRFPDGIDLNFIEPNG